MGYCATREGCGDPSCHLCTDVRHRPQPTWRQGAEEKVPKGTESRDGVFDVVHDALKRKGIAA